MCIRDRQTAYRTVVDSEVTLDDGWVFLSQPATEDDGHQYQTNLRLTGKGWVAGQGNVAPESTVAFDVPYGLSVSGGDAGVTQPFDGAIAGVVWDCLLYTSGGGRSIPR